jgi:hypothetical protein
MTTTPSKNLQNFEVERPKKREQKRQKKKVETFQNKTNRSNLNCASL